MCVSVCVCVCVCVYIYICEEHMETSENVVTGRLKVGTRPVHHLST